MRHRVKKALLDPKLAKLYRDNILLVGGSWDDMDSLKVCRSGIGGVGVFADSCLRQDFLGREPSPMAFINEIEKGLFDDILEFNAEKCCFVYSQANWRAGFVERTD